MTKKFLVFALGIALVSLLQTPSPVVAQSSIQAIGPICFSTAPFVDTLVMFVNASGATANASYYAGNGRDLSGDRVITTNIHIEPGNPATMHFGYTTHPKPGFAPVIAGGTVNLATRSGPGVCYSPDLASCGNFTMAIIACPATASEASGPSQGEAR